MLNRQYLEPRANTPPSALIKFDSLIHHSKSPHLPLAHLHPLPHLLRNLRRQGSRRTLQQIQSNKRQNRTQIQTKDRRNDTPKQIQVWIGNLEHRLKESDALCLGEPREEDTRRNDRVVNGNKVAEASDDDLFGDSISRNGHGEGVTSHDGFGVSSILFLEGGAVVEGAATMEGGVGGRGLLVGESVDGEGTGGASGEEDGGGYEG
mmetsp:Transcript_4995/g.9747  ORF Transcript_4995/g.9747 Transcript_4995/m.9747 type:complete len:206 (+) Transcript_4995:218-835(+)